MKYLFLTLHAKAIDVRIILCGNSPLPEGAGFSVIKEPCLSGAKLDIVHNVTAGSPAQQAGLLRSMYSRFSFFFF